MNMREIIERARLAQMHPRQLFLFPPQPEAECTCNVKGVIGYGPHLPGCPVREQAIEDQKIT